MVEEVIGVQTREGSLELLRELKAAIIGTAGSLHLYKSTFAPTPQSVEADFEAAEADFTGYAAAALVFGTPRVLAGGTVACLSGNNVFTATDAAAPNTIGGAWLHTEQVGPPAVDAAVDFFAFPVPVPMLTALATLGLKVVLTTPDTASYVIKET